MKLKLLVLLASFPILCADVAQHYKKIINKTMGHSIKNIDFIYMINLDHRPEKFFMSMNQLKPYNIEPFRFSAVNGKDLSVETINQLGVKYEPWMKENEKDQKKRITYLLKDEGAPCYEGMQDENKVYFHEEMRRGPLGCALSHLSVLYDAYYNADYKTIWVLEDDIQVIKDPHLISQQIEKLDALVGTKGWDILFTDKDSKFSNGRSVKFVSYTKRPNVTHANIRRYFVRQQVSKDFIKTGSRYGAYSMIIRRSGMKKILDYIDRYKIFLPYDLDFLLPDIEAYTVVDDIVSTQPDALSDIKDNKSVPAA